MIDLSVRGLCKKYENFELNNVSFDLEHGTITGFIGRNGAGKTTTLKSLLNLVHPNSGEILFYGKRFKEYEFEVKQKIGFFAGGIDYYPKKKIKTITATTRRFYKKWNDKAYKHYMDMFNLDENKTPDELSAIEFDRFRKEAGYNAFTLSPQKWINNTNATSASLA